MSNTIRSMNFIFCTRPCIPTARIPAVDHLESALQRLYNVYYTYLVYSVDVRQV